MIVTFLFDNISFCHQNNANFKWQFFQAHILPLQSDDPKECTFWIAQDGLTAGFGFSDDILSPRKRK